MHEAVINLHMHTVYSDGTGTHADLAAAARLAGLDAIIVTDHNVRVEGVEGYFGEGNDRVLVLIGEEVHDQNRDPQKNHLLVFGAEKEMATFTPDPQTLIDEITEAGGLSFLAHPSDPEAPVFNEPDLSWEAWEVQGYTGIELWNAMTEFKTMLTSYPRAIYYAFSFQQVGHGPLPQTLARWEQLLKSGRPVVAVGGSDAHRLIRHLGPLSRLLFPYEDHFRAVNTHLLLPRPLSGVVQHDKALIYQALRAGHAFIGYDLPAPTSGFRFSAHCKGGVSWMGDTLSLNDRPTLQIKLPASAESRLLRDGEVALSSPRRQQLIYQVTEPGVYRVEAYIQFKGRRRTWIISNPIYVR
ncbi:MAG: PHP domain-containing protein [Anaerolineae bacterium]|nr:MAG: PHP domain-containing protein [Anaerolineae bacterium]